MKCINTNTPGYATLREMTGLEDFEINALIRDYYEKYDEIPTVDKCLTVDHDTAEHLIKTYNLKRIGDSFTTDLEINQVEVNNVYRDLEVEVKHSTKGIPIVKIKRRALLNRDLETDDNFFIYPNPLQSTDEILPLSNKDNKYIYYYNGLYYVTDLRISDYSVLLDKPNFVTLREAELFLLPKTIQGINKNIINIINKNINRLEAGFEILVSSNIELPNSFKIYPNFTYPNFKVDDTLITNHVDSDGEIYISSMENLEEELLKLLGITDTTSIINSLNTPMIFDVINNGNNLYTIKLHKETYEVLQDNPANKIISQDTNLEPMLDRLEELYGIHFNRVTNEEIRNSNLNKYVTNATLVNAFILNGEIYINMDNAKADAPIHELAHLLLGTLKQTNPEMYKYLVDSVELYPEYEYELSRYKYRSRSDANEEIFVDLFARHYVNGLNLDVNLRIEYEIARNLDSAIFPNISLTKQDLSVLMGKSLNELMVLFGTAINKDNIARVFEQDLGAESRIIANIKERLFRQNNLKEYCNG